MLYDFASWSWRDLSDTDYPAWYGIEDVTDAQELALRATQQEEPPNLLEAIRVSARLAFWYEALAESAEFPLDNSRTAACHRLNYYLELDPDVRQAASLMLQGEMDKVVQDPGNEPIRLYELAVYLAAIGHWEEAGALADCLSASVAGPPLAADSGDPESLIGASMVEEELREGGVPRGYWLEEDAPRYVEDHEAFLRATLRLAVAVDLHGGNAIDIIAVSTDAATAQLAALGLPGGTRGGEAPGSPETLPMTSRECQLRVARAAILAASRNTEAAADEIQELQQHTSVADLVVLAEVLLAVAPELIPPLLKAADLKMENCSKNYRLGSSLLDIIAVLFACGLTDEATARVARVREVTAA